MSIIIGGCGSSGSSLLRQVLNRHSDVYIAPETHIFAKNPIYRDWELAKELLFKRSVFGLKSSGLTLFTGFDLKHSDFKSIKVKSLSLDSFNGFTDELFRNVTAESGKAIWGEKTPNNIYHFPDILSQINSSQCIMTTRDPYDNIASLVNRGYSVSYSVSRYLLSNAFGLRTIDAPGLHLVKYEDLVNSPKSTLENLLSSLDLNLNLKYQSEMLKPGKASDDDGTQMNGWMLDESEEIQDTAVGRFDTLENKVKDRIRRACYKLQIKPEIVDKFGLKKNIKAVAKKLKYDYRGKGDLKDDCKWMKKELSKVRLKRSIRGYGQPFNNFPIEVI